MTTDKILWILLALAFGAYSWWSRQRRKAAAAAAPARRAPRTTADEENRAMARKKSDKVASASAAAPTSIGREGGIGSWGYQLQKLNLKRAAASSFDLIVIDYSKDGSDDGALAPDEVAALQAKGDGGKRTVLSYISIGEAESYRFYWNPGWKAAPPAWLLGENPDWNENYAVRFWDEGWQTLVFGNFDAYLDKIIDAGFDGVYLDKCDVYEDIQRSFKDVAKSRRDIAGDMVDFVARLSAYAKERKPGFMIVMQNAEDLVNRPKLLAAIDGIAKEELVFGQDGPEKRNMQDDIDDTTRNLVKARDAGKLVLVVEYLNNRSKVAEAAQYAGGHGFVFYVADKDRELDKLNDAPLVA
jgi:cysteinyl-tRNA synthetase